MREPTNAIYPLKRDENIFIEANIPLKLYVYIYITRYKHDFDILTISKRDYEMPLAIIKRP